ncbi:hypothetical protein, partial [Microcoleus sp. B4-D4]|uniref:hypothetical protein n=1 Tax=Microcoleus sp. B4-D4 TaxID=2818667 RepID=UPI002FD208DE
LHVVYAERESKSFEVRVLGLFSKPYLNVDRLLCSSKVAFAIGFFSSGADYLQTLKIFKLNF